MASPLVKLTVESSVLKYTLSLCSYFRQELTALNINRAEEGGKNVRNQSSRITFSVF